MKKTYRKTKGSALIVSILILIMIVLIALSVAVVTVQNKSASLGEYRSSQSFQITDTIMEETIYDLTKAGNSTVNQLFPGDCDGSGNFKIADGEIELLDVDNNQVDCASNTPTSLVARIKSASYIGGQSRSILASVICASPYQPDSETVALYSFKESEDNLPIIDMSGLNTDGDVHGSVPIQSGVCKARGFDGDTSDYIEIRDNMASSAIQRDESFTVSAWVNVGNASSGWQRIVGKGDDIARMNYDLGVTLTGGWGFRVNGGSGGVCDINTTNSFDTGGTNWHFISGVYDQDDNKIRIYVDGSKEAEGDCSNAAVLNDDDLTIGHAPGMAGAEAFDGIVDEIRISKKALSDSDINAEYQKGSIFNLP